LPSEVAATCTADLDVAKPLIQMAYERGGTLRGQASADSPAEPGFH
jgi:hypothetical protein